MDYHRAEEIVNSGETVEVLYRNKPIWINNLLPEDKMAEITDSEQNSIKVPIEELIEAKI